jgi:PPOX class probable F420-dependent enzyme
MAQIPDSHRDLLDAEFATLGTVDDHGRPQLTELWFLAEDGTVRLSLNTSRQKTKNLQRNPAFSLLILDVANPHRYVELRGDAVVEPDPDYAFADKLAAKYGMDLRKMDQPGESRVVVTLPAEHVHTWG